MRGFVVCGTWSGRHLNLCHTSVGALHITRQQFQCEGLEAGKLQRGVSDKRTTLGEKGFVPAEPPFRRRSMVTKWPKAKGDRQIVY